MFGGIHGGNPRVGWWFHVISMENPSRNGWFRGVPNFGKLEHVSGYGVPTSKWPFSRIHAQFPWRSSLFSDKPNESVQHIPSEEWLIFKSCCLYTSWFNGWESAFGTWKWWESTNTWFRTSLYLAYNARNMADSCWWSISLSHTISLYHHVSPLKWLDTNVV